MSKTQKPNLATVIMAAQNARLRGVNIAMPASVISYDAPTQSCVLQPQVQENIIDETGARTTQRRPAIQGVPVMFPGSGPYSVTWPISPGDTVLMVCSSVSLDRWLALGGELDPIDDRRHHITDAVAIPGLRDFPHAISPAPPTNAMVINPGPNQLLLGGPSASSPVALKSDLDALKTYLDAHTHGGVTVGSGATGPPAGPSPSATGATKVKGV